MPQSIDRRLIRVLMEFIESKTLPAKMRLDAMAQLREIRAQMPERKDWRKAQDPAPNLLGS